MDGRAVGRLTSPAVGCTPLDALTEGQEEQSGAQLLSLRFEQLVPAARSASNAGGPLPLRLPVDEGFAQRELRVQVFGRTGGANFVAPHNFQAHGKELGAALSVAQQWQEYQQRHEAARTSAGQPTSTANVARSSTLSVQSGACDGGLRMWGRGQHKAAPNLTTTPGWIGGPCTGRPCQLLHSRAPARCPVRLQVTVWTSCRPFSTSLGGQRGSRCVCGWRCTACRHVPAGPPA